MKTVGAAAMLVPLETDGLSLAIALLAVLVAAWAAWYTVRVARETSRESLDASRAAAKAETFQRLHETLVDPKAASGRRMLYLAAKNDSFPDPGDTDWDSINYSLALYDTLGGYVENELVDERLVLKAWHHPLQEIQDPAHRFLAHRGAHSARHPWRFLGALLDKAVAYVCDCPVPRVAFADRPRSALNEDAVGSIDQ